LLILVDWNLDPNGLVSQVMVLLKPLLGRSI
jgi:hypothetical protein